MDLDLDFPGNANTVAAFPTFPTRPSAAAAAAAPNHAQPSADPWGMVAPANRRDQTPYEDAIAHALLDALDESLSAFEKRHCINWGTARLAVIVSHTSHAKYL